VEVGACGPAGGSGLPQGALWPDRVTYVDGRATQMAEERGVIRRVVLYENVIAKPLVEAHLDDGAAAGSIHQGAHRDRQVDS